MNAPVKVEWEPSKKDRPASGRYSTAARFLNDEDTWPHESWSVLIEFHKAPNIFEYESGTAKFLVEGAPHNWLKSGAIFEMFEGNRRTAKVTVL